MKILATAKPSRQYRWYKSISDFVIQARLTNSQVRYYEVSDWRNEKCLQEELVKALFPLGLIKDRPFLVKENQNFYAVLHRRKKQYKEIYNKLKGEDKKPPMKKLKKVQDQFQNKIDLVIENLLKGTEFKIDDIQGHIADVNKGLAYYDSPRFTVPFWAFKDKRKGYFTYYVAHELTHQLRRKIYGELGNHNAKFYEIFLKICPVEYQHYEVNYKKTSIKHGVNNGNKLTRTKHGNKTIQSTKRFRRTK